MHARTHAHTHTQGKMSAYGDPSSVLNDDTNLLGIIEEQDESTGNNLTYNRIYTGRAL